MQILAEKDLKLFEYPEMVCIGSVCSCSGELLTLRKLQLNSVVSKILRIREHFRHKMHDEQLSIASVESSLSVLFSTRLGGENGEARGKMNCPSSVNMSFDSFAVTCAIKTSPYSDASSEATYTGHV